MELERGRLARIDRRLLAELSRDERFQMVRVPVTPARWSTWKRNCNAAGISMGRAIVALIDRELASVFGDSGGEALELAHRAEEELARREAEVAARERDLKAVKERLRSRGDHLRGWEAELEAREQRVELASKLAVQRRNTAPKVGRNERCPCGSGLKYKHCHGLPGRYARALPRRKEPALEWVGTWQRTPLSCPNYAFVGSQGGNSQAPGLSRMIATLCAARVMAT